MVTPAGIVTTYAGNGALRILGRWRPGHERPVKPARRPGRRCRWKFVHRRFEQLGSAYGHSGGVISTVAGTGGSQGYAGDGGAATSAKMMAPFGVAVDSSGNLYIADFYGWIRKVTASTGVDLDDRRKRLNRLLRRRRPATAAQFYYPVAWRSIWRVTSTSPIPITAPCA